MNLFQAIILSIIEGITEFLPISSTGHMILASSMMGIEDNEFTKLFTVCIQFGAILSVVVLYWKRFFNNIDFYIKLLIAFIPAAIIGFLFSKKIDAMLESPLVVAINLLVGGIFLLFVDKIFKSNPSSDTTEVSYWSALKIGFFQCIAMMPGVSRSAATIIGGLSQGLNRKSAAEFSFFLAVPTMFAATAYKLLKSYKEIQTEHLSILVLGNLFAFVVAIIAIKFLIGFLNKHGFKLFGYYRIVLGIIILTLLIAGVPLQIT
ncbi:MAG: undecaprenyl-diphosphate phosphatase [Cytophagales bacterium]|nr:MAG: undecaprenyl-diphosphate phosphatase [Cytophagales bacterium]